jgi:hypothetical protein
LTISNANTTYAKKSDISSNTTSIANIQQLLTGMSYDTFNSILNTANGLKVYGTLEVSYSNGFYNVETAISDLYFRSNGVLTTVASIYAPMENPIFSGTITFPANSIDTIGDKRI